MATPCSSPPDIVATTLSGCTAAEVKPMCSLISRADFRAHALDVEQAPGGVRLAAHEHVAPDRLLLAQRPFLVDRFDPQVARAHTVQL